MVIEQDADSVYRQARVLARADDAPVSVRHVAAVCHDHLAARGVGVYLQGDLGASECVHATTDTVGRMIELQITLGEGPAMTALRDERPVLVTNLSHPTHLARWPVFAAAAMADGLFSVFAFPLVMGRITIGALEVYRSGETSLSGDELDLAMVFVELMSAQLLMQVGKFSQPDAEVFVLEETHGRWLAVHQATGMVSVQLRCTLAEALLRLRGHAYATGRRLTDVADDVVEGKLRLRADVCGEDNEHC